MKIKCYSVRLESLVSISEKCYKATAFNGSTALIPKSQVFGQDYDVQKSDAYWISEWILKQKDLQYSSKKVSWFEKDWSSKNEDGVTIEVHVPEQKESVSVEPVSELMKEYTAVYDTEKHNNVNYSFKAINMEEAEKFCKHKISVPVKSIIED